jgi:threonyl-tRNA synthetase
VGKAIRAAEKDKIPVMCVIGQREADEGAVAVRTYAEGDLGSMPAAELVARIAAASAARSAVL